MLDRKTIRCCTHTYYFLGIDANNTEYFLEEPSWDCNWYWGFGYIETFNENFTDILSHQHATDFYPEWVLKDNSILVETPFTEKEQWWLSEYFNQFYLFKKISEYYYVGHTGISSVYNKHISKKKWKEINNFLKTEIIDNIIKIVKGEYNIKKKNFSSREKFDNFMDKYSNSVIEYNVKNQNDIDVTYVSDFLK